MAFTIGKLGGLVSGLVNKFKGNTDFLEASCALCALTAAADGSIDDDEISAAIDAVKTNKTLSEAFSARQIENTMETMLERTKTRTGRVSLWSELKDIEGDEDMGQIVVLAAIEVADADGNIDADEKEILTKAGKMFKVNVNELIEV